MGAFARDGLYTLTAGGLLSPKEVVGTSKVYVQEDGKIVGGSLFHSIRRRRHRRRHLARGVLGRRSAL